ncbi:hypothetical protein CWO90_42770 [Bradyrhizobium sp. Leo121]|nr:hypothetical protein CWO90_42770 [Bradyrhizobium sp. Leo121]
MQRDEQEANDAVRDRFASQAQLLQPRQRRLVDRYEPIAVWQAPSGRAPAALSIKARHSSVISIFGIALIGVLAGLKPPVLA